MSAVRWPKSLSEWPQLLKLKNPAISKQKPKVPDTRAAAEATVGEDVVVEVKHDEDTTGKSSWSYFSYDKAHGEWWIQQAKQAQKDKAKGKRGPTLSDRIIQWIEAK